MVNKTLLAQCVGLWLAEGDHKTVAEITFTNNQRHLIELFDSIVSEIFTLENTPRVYVYSRAGKEEIRIPSLENAVFRFYTDVRANRPYFIYRIAGRKLVILWRKLVEELSGTEGFYAPILQGFFAGEGNIKYIKKSRSRVLRISQGKRNELIERILGHFTIKYSYSRSERSYVVSGRDNLEKLVGMKISCLHPEKDAKLVNMLSTYRQRHYPKNQLRGLLQMEMSDKPMTSNELSEIFNRDQSRITKVLVDLKKMGNVQEFRVGSLNYWTANGNIAVISDKKERILGLLDGVKKMSEIAKILKVNDRSISRRLKELEKLNLVEKKDGIWCKKPNTKEVIVYSTNVRDRRSWE